MQLEFYGAAGEVTGSCHVLRAGGRQFLLDCGLIQGGNSPDARNRQPFPFEASSIEAVHQSTYDFINDNPAFEFRTIDYTNNVLVISRQKT